MTEELKQASVSGREGSIGVGILYGLGATFLYGLAAVLLSWLLSQLHYYHVEYVLGTLLFIGAVQLLWVVPLFFYLRRAGLSRTAKGLVIAASIIALLNAACWGSVFSM